MIDINYFEQYKYCALEADRAYTEIKHIETFKEQLNAITAALPAPFVCVSSLTCLQKQLADNIRSYEQKQVEIINTINAIKPRRTRDVIYLRYVQGLTFAEVGKVLGISERWAGQIYRDFVNER